MASKLEEILRKFDDWVIWLLFAGRINCDCAAPVMHEKYHRKTCASWGNARPDKRNRP